MKVTENTSPIGADRLVYDHTPDDKWKTTGPYGINHREDPQTEHPDGMIVHLDGNAEDLATHGGVWDDKCVERVEGENVILSYSDGSVKGGGNLRLGSVARQRRGPSVLPRGIPGATSPLQRTRRAPLHTKMPGDHPTRRLGRNDPPPSGQPGDGKKIQAHETRVPRGDGSRRGPVGRYATVLQRMGPQNQDHLGEKGTPRKAGN